jgi:hypothetical protein
MSAINNTKLLSFTNIRPEVLTAVVMQCSILWDIRPRSPLKVNRIQRVISQKIELFTIIRFTFVFISDKIMIL